jgi:hypothetical protein
MNMLQNDRRRERRITIRIENVICFSLKLLQKKLNVLLMKIIVLFFFFLNWLGRGGHLNGSPQKREGHAVRQPMNPA